MFEGADVEGIVDLVNCNTKRELVKYCRGFTLKSRDFSLAIFSAQTGGFAPYKYASCFREWLPPHLALTEENLGAISANGLGPLGSRAQKTMTKVSQIFKERRQLAAHLLYTDDYAFWYLFYFDQRDHARRDNHWEHGAHIHLLTHHWTNLELSDVWSRVQRGDANFPSKIHLRFEKVVAEPPEQRFLRPRLRTKAQD